MTKLEKSIAHIALAAAFALSLAACEKKPDTGKASQAVSSATQNAVPAATAGEGESETRAGPPGVGDDGIPHGPRAGMERGREAREHGMGMAPQPPPADKPTP